LKAAFEQIYGAPYLARLLFAEVGPRAEEDLFLRVEYDGAIATTGSGISESRQNFAALSVTRRSTELMEALLKSVPSPINSLGSAINAAIDAWSVGHMMLGEESSDELPERSAIAKHRQDQLATSGIEAAVLERGGGRAIRYRSLSDDEVRSAIQG
jgi:proteasome alpha subunit